MIRTKKETTQIKGKTIIKKKKKKIKTKRKKKQVQ